MLTVAEELLEITELADVSDQLERGVVATRDTRDLAARLSKVVEQRLDKAHHAVAKVAVAGLLGLTDETVNAWVRRGILKSATDPDSPKETVQLESVIDVHRRVVRLRALGVADKSVWGKLLAAGLGEGGQEFSSEDLEIIGLNRRSRGRGLLLPVPPG
ncbi:MAG: hypothetical protein ACR2MY_06770 [Candidatus Dormibacteria bacterium]